jgi:hypothetical protein
MIRTEQMRNVEFNPGLPAELKPPPEVEVEKSAQPSLPDTDEMLYLAGRPTLRQFRRFVRHNAVDPGYEGDLTDEWNAAAEHIAELEKGEAGLADNPVITKLGPEYEPLLIELLKDPLIQNGFDTVPTDIAMIELDSLVVYQKHIDLTYIGQLKQRIGPAPDWQTIFRTCLPYDHPQPPVKWSKHGEKYFFMSPSNDLRFLGTMNLKPGNIVDYAPPGDMVGVVGLALGFGSNFLNAALVENRLILHNGSHRAFALRDLGVTHVPCIIEHVSSRAEMEVVASSEVRENPNLYLKHPRPPMLRDYFNPRLRKVMPVNRQLRQIIVKFSVEEYYVPAL